MDRPRRRTRLALAVSAGLLAVLGVLVVTGWAPLVRLDVAVTDEVGDRTVGLPALVAATVVVTDVLGPWPLRFVLVVVATLLAVRGRRRAALWTVVATAVGSLAGGALKVLVSRSRPAPADPLLDEAGFAWPSGHASTAALAAGILVALATPSVRRWLVPVVALGAVVVGASRVLLGVHWASDVVSGWLLGLAVVLAAVALAPPYGSGDRPAPGRGRPPPPPGRSDHR